ncbi:uncharacterized protein LOC106644412 [Copidosoma floridanum]|uniref:uncharacterized protein LOC106644412 n=1 Tax=Copidosoma floridanum TaxID=29053 RepID=UPI0006C9DD34|nr:uncharacterized protein LOC106644412 [Copidosoma floridanum]
MRGTSRYQRSSRGRGRGMDYSSQTLTSKPPGWGVQGPAPREFVHQHAWIGAPRPKIGSVSLALSTSSTDNMTRIGDAKDKQILHQLDQRKTSPVLPPMPISSGYKLQSHKRCMALIPDGYMGICDTVKYIPVSSIERDSNGDFEVMVSETVTPSIFCVMLLKNCDEFNEFMSRLGDFYEEKDVQSLKVPRCILQPGLNVCCNLLGVWYRAMIIKIRDDGSVVVFFYDYGIVRSYDSNDLFFLHESFSKLPAQAIVCGLHDVKPIGSYVWPKSSTDAFADKVLGLLFVARIHVLREDNNTMVVSLTTKMDKREDGTVSDWMVKNKLANWGEMVSYDEAPLHERVRDAGHSHKQVTSYKLASVETKRDDKLPAIDNSSMGLYHPKENPDSMEETNVMDQSICADVPSRGELHESSTESNINSLMKISIENSQDSGEVQANERGKSPELAQKSSMIPTVSKRIDGHVSRQPSKMNVQTETKQNEKSDQLATDNPRQLVNTDLGENVNPASPSVCSRGTSLDFNKDFVESNNSEGNQVFEDSVSNKDGGPERGSPPQTRKILDENSVSTQDTAYFMIHLSEKMDQKAFHVFHYDKEGWLFLEEFVKVFTNLKEPKVFLKILDVLNCSLPLKLINRDTEPQLFSQLDKSALIVPREHNKVKSDFDLTLMPLRSMFKVLEKLGLVSVETMLEASYEIKRLNEEAAQKFLFAKYKNKILYDSLNIVLQYKKFRRAIDGSASPNSKFSITP